MPLEQGHPVDGPVLCTVVSFSQVMPDRANKSDGAIPAGNAAKPDTDGAGSVRETATEPESPFDLWLERGLHKLFDDIAQEPIPDALLKIIEQDRKKP